MDREVRAAEPRAVLVGVLLSVAAFVAAVDAIVIQDGTSVNAVRPEPEDTGMRVYTTLVPLLVTLLLPAVVVFVAASVAQRKGWVLGRPGVVAGGAFFGGLLGLNSYGDVSGWNGYVAFTGVGTYAGHVVGLMLVRSTELPGWVAVLHVLVLDVFAVPALVAVPDPTFVLLLGLTYSIVLAALLVRYVLRPRPASARKAFAGAVPSTRR